MFHRTFIGLFVDLVASSVLSPAAAQPAAVEVIIDSVTPGTPSGDGDWCVGGAEQVTLTARVVDLETQSEVTEGLVWFQLCESSAGVFPKEDCEPPGPPRWKSEVGEDLSAPFPPSQSFPPIVPVQGFRLQYRPAPGGLFKRATSVPFNLDTTCSP